MPCVVIAGGGTGGHIFPAIAIARELRERVAGCEVLMVGTERGLETKLVPREGLPLLTIPVAGLRGKSVVKAAKGMAMLPGALIASWRILSKHSADAVVGVGGYASGPIVAAAVLRRVPTLIHEQNIVPGATNRWVAPWVREVALTWEETRAHLKGRGVVTGNPVRREFAAVGARPRGRSTRHLLVFGGSQGASAINEGMKAALSALAPLKGSLRIVHQTGEAHAESVRAAYAAGGFEADVRPFIEKMADAMAEADLVVARSGGPTVAELTACGRGSILVPFPAAAHDEQTLHARALEKNGAAVLLHQRDLSGRTLGEALVRILGDEAALDAMAAAARKMGRPDAAARIADLVRALMGGTDRSGRRRAS
jgi:UDP-N-acetylglucosamine--N-acetylmuramyl-(pentapeptide) pyrophosphoryl-undecaprenol N-acetylglucosamine transferase